MTRVRWLILGGLILTFLLYYYIKAQELEVVRKSGATSFNQRGAGLSFLVSLSRKWGDEKTILVRKAFFREEDFNSIRTLVIASPKSPVSAREASFIESFVRKGGILWLSAHDEATWRALSPLIKLSEIKESVQKDKSFKNFQVRSLKPDLENSLLKATETYAFYSNQIFSGEACRDRGIGCYLRSLSLDKGLIVVQLGLPLFSNALIQRNDNAQIVRRLIENFSPMALDEYHQLFSEKELSDLLTKWDFSLPIAGLVLIMLLFFIFGRTEFHRKIYRRAQNVSTQNYHAFYERILLRQFQYPALRDSILRQHHRYLVSLLPQHRDQIPRHTTPSLPDKSVFLNEGRRYLQIHKRILKGRWK